MADTYAAHHRGKYLSMTVEGRNISIHESCFLEVGEEMTIPSGAFVLLVVHEPDRKDDQ